jgi:protein transport protein SEC13
VWQVSWAHPKFGVLLASCSYDRQVLIHREAEGYWSTIYSHRAHESSVNSIAWAPYEFGLVLACASSDGSVSVIRHQGTFADTGSVSLCFSVVAGAVAGRIHCLLLGADVDVLFVPPPRNQQQFPLLQRTTRGT